MGLVALFAMWLPIVLMQGGVGAAAYIRPPAIETSIGVAEAESLGYEVYITDSGSYYYNVAVVVLNRHPAPDADPWAAFSIGEGETFVAASQLPRRQSGRSYVFSVSKEWLSEARFTFEYFEGDSVRRQHNLRIADFMPR